MKRVISKYRVARLRPSLRPALVLRPALTLLLVLLSSSCYVTTQGYHLARQQIAARPIDGIAPGRLPPDEQSLLAEAERVRRFAVGTIGLSDSGAYTVYYRTQRDHLVDVVSAAGEFSFERREWWFPFMGRFPYKGFYRRAGAERLAARLERRGWDVIIRPVEAFSTLGFFRDPLVSFMADYPAPRLAELIIHEKAHATVWVRGEGQFNEEFATFVGREGARRFIARRYPGDAEGMVAEWQARRRDSARFREDIQSLRSELAAFYAASSGVPVAERREDKAARITSFQRGFAKRYDERYETEAFRAFAEITVNNAYIDLFETYSGSIDRFEDFHLSVGQGELARTVELIRQGVEAWESTPRRQRPPIHSVLDGD